MELVCNSERSPQFHMWALIFHLFRTKSIPPILNFNHLSNKQLVMHFFNVINEAILSRSVHSRERERESEGWCTLLSILLTCSLSSVMGWEHCSLVHRCSAQLTSDRCLCVAEVLNVCIYQPLWVWWDITAVLNHHIRFKTFLEQY